MHPRWLVTLNLRSNSLRSLGFGSHQPFEVNLESPLVVTLALTVSCKYQKLQNMHPRWLVTLDLRSNRLRSLGFGGHQPSGVDLESLLVVISALTVTQKLSNMHPRWLVTLNLRSNRLRSLGFGGHQPSEVDLESLLVVTSDLSSKHQKLENMHP